MNLNLLVRTSANSNGNNYDDKDNNNNESNYSSTNKRNLTRGIKLRELTGYDEQSLIETKGLPPFLRSILLLERVLTIAEEKGDDQTRSLSKTIRELKIGDRSFLMLLLRKLNFGNTILCAAKCPNCKEAISIDISINDMLLEFDRKDATIISPSLGYDYSIQKATPKYKGASLRIDGYSITIRPLTGRDQELLLLNNEGIIKRKDDKDSRNYNLIDNKVENCNRITSTEQLIRSCIISCVPPLPPRISRKLLLNLSSKLEELDPYAEISLQPRCPNCDSSFQTLFNPEEFWLNEIDSRSKQLERQVHWIAFNYHWNEDTILSLPIKKRKAYLELINKTLAGEAV